MDIYELIGFAIGDGNIYYNSKYGVYRLELVGNVEEDYDYFNQLDNFLFLETGRKPVKFIRQEIKNRKSLRIQVNNKEFVDRLINMGLPIGKKFYTIQIPRSLFSEEFMYSIIRGIFEADGCLYFSKVKI